MAFVVTIVIGVLLVALALIVVAAIVLGVVAPMAVEFRPVEVKVPTAVNALAAALTALKSMLASLLVALRMRNRHDALAALFTLSVPSALI